MGCVSSKQTVTPGPVDYNSGRYADNAGAGSGRKVALDKRSSRGRDVSLPRCDLRDNSGRWSSTGGGDTLSFRFGNLQKHVEGEQVAAGWPTWLTAVAGEAIHGWVPLPPDGFEKLEKIGQGTFSTVFRAREVDTGKIVALKKVRFDNFEPESVRFMAREITILRRLDHPNVIKLEGIITSRLSCSIYLVFEYMEHDLSGLLACPDIKFTEAQIKCYMKQLLSGIDHCHSKGVMHRDIKGANLLINNEGILKVADFGLANFSNLKHRQPLTSRVVTLWYRPPELLLGSTDYSAFVDLWSVGCVFAEILMGRPVLRGRTEVEQLHKIFKLCGSPPEAYWKQSKLPHTTLFKPQQPYESSLRENFKSLPGVAVNLIETLLSVEPYKRGTAASALASEYFATKPYACEPSCLPNYPPNKEIDAKNREEARSKKVNGRIRAPDAARKLSRKSIRSKLVPAEDTQSNIEGGNKTKRNDLSLYEGEGIFGRQLWKPTSGIPEDSVHAKHASQGDIPFSGPLQVSASSGFAWAKKRDDASARSRRRTNSRGWNTYENTDADRNDSDIKRQETMDKPKGSRTNSKGHDSAEITKRSIRRHWSQIDHHPDSPDDSEVYHSQELSLAMYLREKNEKKDYMGYQNCGDKVKFSGPLLSQSHKVDEFLEKHELQVWRAVRKSWFQKVRTSEK